jgi:hypothetical protein
MAGSDTLFDLSGKGKNKQDSLIEMNNKADINSIII